MRWKAAVDRVQRITVEEKGVSGGFLGYEMGGKEELTEEEVLEHDGLLGEAAEAGLGRDECVVR